MGQWTGMTSNGTTWMLFLSASLHVWYPTTCKQNTAQNVCIIFGIYWPPHKHLTMLHQQLHYSCYRGLINLFSPFCYFPNFSTLWKYTLAIEYHVNIWQVSPQLCCSDTCQIWMWFKVFDWYFWNIKNFAYGEINEQSFSNPHSWCALHSSRIFWIIFPSNLKNSSLALSSYRDDILSQNF